MSTYEEFKSECKVEISAMGSDLALKSKSIDWMIASSQMKYSYHFEWLGRPVIQFPQDIVALQEIIWNLKPDLIIETGVAHGGSLVLSASILALLDLIDTESNNLASRKRIVVGIDIDIREQNRIAIETHPLSKRIKLIEGSSTDPETIREISELVVEYPKVMVILDSNHSHDHVYNELKLYSKFVTAGQYLVVFDTVIENFPPGSFLDRNWDKGDNPYTAVQKFISENNEFYVDTELENKLLITVAPSGYLVKK